MIISPNDPLIVARAKAELMRRQRERAEAEVKNKTTLSLYEFVKVAWSVLEPDTRFIDGWHIEAVCRHLEAVTDGRIKRLLINIPPGSMKSLLACVFWPAWEWGERSPSTRWLFGSYAEKLALRDSVRMRRLIRSAWYQRRYGQKFSILKGSDTKARYDNSRGGYRISTSVGGTGTGERADRVVIDDPQKKIEIHTSKRERANEWIKSEIRTRGTSPDFSIVVIQQRLHEHDASGFILEEMAGFEHLRIPARFEPDSRCSTSIGWEDPRTEDREIYWQMYDEASLSSLETDLGPMDTAGQLQQRPYPAGGEVFRETYWRFWCFPGQTLPPVRVRDEEGNTVEIYADEYDLDDSPYFDQHWDLTFTDKETSAYVCGQVWGYHQKYPARRYLVDQRRQKADILATIEMITALRNAHPKTRSIQVENKANGPAVIRILRDHIQGVLPVETPRGKEARAIEALPIVAAGNVYLPHPANAPWVHGLLSELSAFPKSRYKDQVDTLVQALLQSREGEVSEAIVEDAILAGLTSNSYFLE